MKGNTSITAAEQALVAGAVQESDYAAQSILMAVADDTPLPVTVGASTIVGRTAAGDVAALSAADARTVLNVADGADVTGSNAPQAHAASHVAGDAIQSATAAQDGLATSTQITKLDGIAAGADVTSAALGAALATYPYQARFEIETNVAAAPGNTFVYRWAAPFACTIVGIRLFYQTLGASAGGGYLFTAAGDGAENLLVGASVNLETVPTAATLYNCGLTATAADLAIAANGIVTVTVASDNADLISQSGAWFQLLYRPT